MQQVKQLLHSNDYSTLPYEVCLKLELAPPIFWDINILKLIVGFLIQIL
jgi:hypothetical protein